MNIPSVAPIDGADASLLPRLFEAFPAAVFICDRDGLVTFFNRSFVDLFGRAPRLNDSADRFCESFALLSASGAPIERERCWIARALTENRDIRGQELVVERDDGTRIAVLAQASPIRNAQGDATGVVNVLVHVSERRKAEQALQESEQRFDRFMRHLPGLAWIKNQEGEYVFVNDGAVGAFGHAREDIVGRKDEDLFPADTAMQFRANDARALATGAGVAAIETLKHVDGVHHSIVSKFPIPGMDGQPAMVGGMAVDITEQIRVEQALRESEARFRQMADHVPALIWVNDRDGCDYVNHEYLRFLGREMEDVRGMKWAEFVHPEDLEAYIASYLVALGAQRPFDAEFRFRRADGEYRWLRSTGIPRFAADDSLIGYIGCSVDIEEAKRSSESLHAVTNSLSDQLADLRRLHEMSVRMSKTLELESILEETLRTATAFEGTDLGLISLCDAQRTRLEIRASIGFDAEFLAIARDVAPEGGPCRASFLTKDRVVIEDVELDPSFEPYREAARRAGFRAVHSTPLITRAGEVVGVLSTHFRRPHRPTDRDTHLIDLCARQAVDFIENAWLYDELREADRRKDEFLATLAHELRNPLAPISNSLQFLRLDGDLSPTSTRVLEIMEQQVQHLVRLVDDLLEVSRITRGKIELRRERVDLASLILSAVETSRPRIEACGHQLAVTLPPAPITIEADPVRITQVVANLLNNAAKFMEPGGQIWLSAKRENGDAVITVRDTGIGIAADLLPRIFEIFAQGNRALNRSQGGLGLGLTLARSLVQMHGGRITAQSAGQGQGSEFVVRLPVVDSPGRVTAPRGGDSAALPRKKVLVVDDSESAQYVLGKLLEKLGQEVRTTSHAVEGLELALVERPDIIISDIAMPQMDGYEFAKRIRGQSELCGVTLVALTGYGQENDRQKALEAGFDHHLTKPVSSAALRELLRREAPATSGPSRVDGGAFSP